MSILSVLKGFDFRGFLLFMTKEKTVEKEVLSRKFTLKFNVVTAFY